MSDPVRWSRGGGAPDAVSELLRAAQKPRGMTAAERARTAARVSQIAQGAGAGAVAATHGAVLAKGIALAAGLIAIGAVGRALLPAPDVRPAAAGRPAEMAPDRAPDRAPDPTAAQDHGLAAPVDPSGDALGAPENAVVARAAPAPARAASAPTAARARAEKNSARPASKKQGGGPAGNADALLEEAESLERARGGLAGDPASSLSVLHKHLERFPEGQLDAEREYLTIDALVRLGRRDEARARARAFIARHPGSPYATEVRRVLDQDP
jgi:hypothetical protein